MANLLSWNTGLGLQKKRDDNRLTPLMNSLQITANRNVNNNINATNNAVARNNFAGRNSSTSNFGNNNAFESAQAINDQIRQQAELRRQQEEERQRQIEEMRRQQEEAQRKQQQQVREQQQQRLLNSAGLLPINSGALYTKSRQDVIKQNQLRQQAEAEKQQQLNEAETNKLINTYAKRLSQNTDALNRFRAGENMPGQLNAYGDYTELGLTNNFGQKESPFAVKNQLPITEKQLENRVKEDEKNLEMVKNGAKPITLAHGLRLVGDELSQALGNAILGEQTENESPLKQLARGIINIPTAASGALLGVPDLIGNAVTPYATRNEIEKGQNGTATLVTKENTPLTRVGSAADAGLRIMDALTGGEKQMVDALAGAGIKTTAKNVLKNMGKTALEEGAQEAAENLAEELADKGKWDEGTLGRTAQSAALGAATGGVMSGVGSLTNNVKARISDAVRSKAQGETNTNANNILSMDDGTIVKTNADGTVSSLTDSELAKTIEGIPLNESVQRIQNVRNGNLEKVNSDGTTARLSNEELAEVAANDDIAMEDLDAIWGKSEETAPAKPKYNEAEAMQKLVEVMEGQKPFTDYVNEQRELMWQSFKDSNRGTESFLHKDENGNFDRRDTVSNNGTLYRQLYEEYGGRPTKAAFNEALDDVLANGQNSKYYDGFREFDHDGERSVFGFNQGNENIGLILDMQDDIVKDRITTNPSFDRLSNNPKSIFNSDVAKELGIRATNNDLDLYQRALNGETLTRKEIQDSPISRKFEEYSRHNDGKTVITPDQEKGIEPIDQSTIERLNNVATDYMNSDESLKNAKNEGNAVIVLGMPASGKSSNAVDIFAKQGYFVLDNDNIKTLFPEYNNGLGAGNVHNASSYVANRIVLPEIAGNKTNVVIPVVGKTLTSLENYATILKEAGYGNIDLVNVDLPIDKTATRNFTRLLETSRNVPMDYIYDVVGDNPTKNYNLIKERINNGTETNFTSYSTISTDVPYGSKARVIEDSRGIWLPGESNSKYSERAGANEGYSDGAPQRPRNQHGLGNDGPNGLLNKSQFAENTSGNRNFSTETRGELKSDPLTYKPTTNEERLKRANDILSTKSSDEIDNYLRENFFNVKPKNADSADMVLAGEYAKMLDAKGQFDRSTEIINKMSEIGTKQGQNIQALSLMMNRSPEGIANMAQTAIKKGGGEMTPELRKQIVENTQEIGRTRSERVKLSDENAKISEQIMNGEGDLKALRKRQMQIGQAYRLNIDQEGRQFSRLSDLVSKNSPDKRSVFGSVWRASLLSGPRTHTGNAVSNTFQNVLNAGADRIAAGLDWARAKATGTERQVVTSAGGRGKGLKRGLKAAGEVLKTGDNLWDGMDATVNKTDAWGQGGELEFKNKVANTMVAKPTNFVFRAMSAGDLPFRYAAFENAIRTEAKRQGINEGYRGQALQDYINSRVATPDPELQAYGMKKGNESVYDVDTKLSDLMSRVDKFIAGQDNKIVKKGLNLTKTVVAPFVKVPSKVLSTAIDYSPIGSVKALVNKIGSKGYTTAQFETDLAKSGLGSAAFVGLGYALSAAGLLTGGYPDSQEERNRWKAEGIEPNSIKIGDKYLSLNYLGPASMLMAMGSGVQQRQAKGEDPLTIAQGTLMDTLNSFLDQSYVQGLNNAVQAITDNQRYGESYGNSIARGLVPNLLRQTAVATDPMQRQANDAKDSIISGIPGLSQTLDAKVDAYGREIENKQALPLGQMWDALKLNNSRETNEVIDEVGRLHNVDEGNKDLQITPPMEDNTLSVDGAKVKITDAQKTQLQKDVGAAALKAMRSVMQSDQYAGLSDTEKAAALDKARSNAQTEAREKFIKANNITADNNPETKNSGGETTGEYADKAINSAKSSEAKKDGGARNNSVSINDSLSQEDKDTLNKYNSMTSEDWDKFINGSSTESAAAEYKLAKAKYENDLAEGKINDAQKVKKEKELRKLGVSKDWEKKYRDAYGLAGTKSDMQEYLNGLDNDTRAKTVSVLNGLNRAMYEAGVITASTYKTRYNAINNTTTAKKSSSKKGRKGSSSKSSEGISSAEASAMSSLAKTMVKNTTGAKVQTTKAPETQRKMAKTNSNKNQTKLATYTAPKKKISVTRGTKRSVG